MAWLLRLSPSVAAAGGLPGYTFSSAGSTAVWATENTREGIWNGMQSKETSGTLIRLRFFAGWNYSKNLVTDKNFVKKAYKSGVPMGSDLLAPGITDRRQRAASLKGTLRFYTI